MPVITYRDVCRKIKSGEALGGVYIFFGDEDYTKADAVAKLRAAAAESGFPEFNVVRLTASEFTPDALSSAVETPPMMSELKTVEVGGTDVLSAKFKGLDAVIATLGALDDDVAAVFACPADSEINEKTVTGSEVYKALSAGNKKPLAVNCAKASPAELSKWIGARLAALGATASDAVRAELAARCGYSMFTLVGEITKLAMYAGAHGRSEVTAEDLHTVVSEDPEFGAFDLSNAISERRMADALAIYAKMKRKGEQPKMILGSLVSNFTVLYRMKLALDAGMPYQTAAKTFSVHEYRAKIMYGNLRRTSDGYMEKALKLFSEADEKYKSLDVDVSAQIETLICRLALI